MDSSVPDHDILERIRMQIWIRGSLSPAIFVIDRQDGSFSAYYFLQVHLHLFQSPKEVIKQ